MTSILFKHRYYSPVFQAFITFCLLCLPLPGTAASTPLFEISKHFNDIRQPYPQTLVLEDKERKLSLDQVIALFDKKRGNAVDGKRRVVIGFSTSAYWIVFRAVNDDQQRDSYYLNVSNDFFHHLELFTEVDGRIETYSPQGRKHPIDHRAAPSFSPLFEVNTPYDVPITYYLRIVGPHSLSAAITFLTPEMAQTKNSFSEKSSLLYTALVVVLFIASIGLYFTRRNISYLLNGIWMVSFALFNLSYDGWLFYHFSSIDWLNTHFHLPTMFLSSITIIAFLFKFMNLTVSRGLVFQFYRVVVTIAVIALVTSLFMVVQELQVLATCLGAATGLSGVIYGFYLVSQRDKPAKIFLYAFFSIFVAVIISAFADIGLIEKAFYHPQLLKAGHVIYGVIILYAISLRERKDNSVSIGSTAYQGEI